MTVVQDPVPKSVVNDVHTRHLLSTFVASAATVIVILVATGRQLPYLSYDSHYYILLAEGHPEQVAQPFSTRVLHPWLVHALNTLAGMGTHEAFLAWALLSLLVLCLSITSILGSAGVPKAQLVALAVLVTPHLASLFRDYYLPDLFHAALLGVFFLLMLASERSGVIYRWASLLIVLLLYLTRESTILLILTIGALSFLRASDRKYALAAIAVAIMATPALSYAAHLGQPNIHRMSDALYAALKVPFNFSRNILGVQFWTNTFAAQPGGTCEPLVTHSLPEWLHLGAVRDVGLCRFDPLVPVRTLVTLLTAFGVAPTVAIYYLGRRSHGVLRKTPLWLAVALSYGLLCFFLGATLGASVERLMGYGWPAFWIAAPVLLSTDPVVDRRLVSLLLPMHLTASWLPWIVERLDAPWPQAGVTLLLVSLVLQLASYRSLHKLAAAS